MKIEKIKQTTQITILVVCIALLLMLFASFLSRRNTNDDMETCMYRYKDYQYCIERVTGNENNN